MCDLGMTLFKELAIPLDDVRGMGLIMSKLDNKNPDPVTAPAQGLAKWLKKSKPESRQQNKAQGLNPPTCVVGHGEDELENFQANQQDPRFPKEDFDLLDIVNDDSESISVHDDVPVARLEIPLTPHTQLTQPSQLTQQSQITPRTHFSQKADTSEGNSEIETLIESATETRGPENTSGGDEAVAPVAPALTQIALPPLSQIRMSQVKELPQEFQEQIMANMRSRRGGMRPNEGVETVDGRGHGRIVDAEDVPTANQEPVQEEASKGRKQRHRANHRTNDRGSNRFRQTNVQRMMKLAAVKTGQEASSLALSQLDHLPLEIKLQVVNQDSCPIGALSPRKLFSSNQRQSVGITASREKARPSPARRPQQSASREETKSVGQNTPTRTGNETKSDPETPTLLPVDVYEEDILPLRLFLNENPPASAEAVDNVVAFLITCLKEERMKDLVTLFRSIRNRGDDWSKQAVLLELVKPLDEEHVKRHGFRLDVDWLIGTR